MIVTTLTARRRRATMLAAKAGVLTAVVLAAGTLAVLASLLAVSLLLPGDGFITTHWYLLLFLGDDSTLRAAAGSGIYLALIALLSLGIATAARDQATAIGVVLALLYLLPITAAAVSGLHRQRHLQQIGTMNPGLAIQATNLQSLPISPGASPGVLVAWAAGALVPGTPTLRLRHA